MNELMEWLKFRFDMEHRDQTLYWVQLGSGILALAAVLALLVSGWWALVELFCGFAFAIWFDHWLNTPPKNSRTGPQA